eukprot:15443922-Alexandrium_andersonii.AAC.1
MQVTPDDKAELRLGSLHVCTATATPAALSRSAGPLQVSAFEHEELPQGVPPRSLLSEGVQRLRRSTLAIKPSPAAERSADRNVAAGRAA